MNWEISVLHYLQSIRSDFLNHFFQIITASVEIGVLLLVIGITYWCINKEFAKILGFVMLFSGLTNGLVKNIFKAPRPFDLGIVEPIRKHTATGYSFPSGHTQNGTTFWLVLMDHFKKTWLYYLGLVVIVLVALSRLYLGVHWPKDVLVALLLAFISTYVANKIYPYIFANKFTLMVFILLIATSSLLVGVDRDYIKVLGAMLGFILGIYTENNYIDFNTQASFKNQIYKVIVGFISSLLVWFGLGFILPKNMFFELISYALVVYWVLAGVPYLFKRYFKNVL